jgi:hypothetical protein
MFGIILNFHIKMKSICLRTLYHGKYMIKKDNSPSYILKTSGIPIVTFCDERGHFC